MITTHNINTRLVRQSFDRAARFYDKTAVLQRTVTDRLLESFDFLNIVPDTVLDLGSGTGYGGKLLRKRFKRADIFQLDLSASMLQQARQQTSVFFSRDHFICANAYTLPFNGVRFDMIFSNLMLQWCSDLDRALVELSRVLKPEGLFMFSSFGPDTLKELRESWQEVDQRVHVNRFIDMHDMGDAMLRAGLQAPVLSVEHIQILYDDATALMQDLKSIGAQNINTGRRQTLTGKGRMQKFLRHYEKYRIDKKLPATYEVIYGHAWKTSDAGITNKINHAITLSGLKRRVKARKKK